MPNEVSVVGLSLSGHAVLTLHTQYSLCVNAQSLSTTSMPVMPALSCLAYTSCAKRGLSCRTKHEWANYSWLDILAVYIPMIRWVRKYNIKQNLLVSICIC